MSAELVNDLGALARDILDHNRAVLLCDGTADWEHMAERLAAAASRCRRRAPASVSELTDIGDSGAR